MRIQFNDWFDENVRPSHMLNPFVTWLENKGVQGIHDAQFEPRILEEEWLSFLFYLGRILGKQGGLMEEESVFDIAGPLQNSIEIGETNKGELYIKSIKRYHGSWAEDWQCALHEIFTMYDEARKLINVRKG